MDVPVVVSPTSSLTRLTATNKILLLFFFVFFPHSQQRHRLLVFLSVLVAFFYKSLWKVLEHFSMERHFQSPQKNRAQQDPKKKPNFSRVSKKKEMLGTQNHKNEEVYIQEKAQKRFELKHDKQSTRKSKTRTATKQTKMNVVHGWLQY